MLFIIQMLNLSVLFKNPYGNQKRTSFDIPNILWLSNSCGFQKNQR